MVADTWSGIRGGDFDFNAFSDTFLTLATVAALADGPVKIRGIAHTRKQETDRVLAMATELERLAAATVDGGPAMLVGSVFVRDGALHNGVALLEGGRVLVVDADSTLVERRLKTGLSNWEFTEVVEGLAAGDRIVTSLDRAGVKAGARVTVESKPAK